jgi:hypothetical protein
VLVGVSAADDEGAAMGEDEARQRTVLLARSRPVDAESEQRIVRCKRRHAAQCRWGLMRIQLHIVNLHCAWDQAGVQAPGSGSKLITHRYDLFVAQFLSRQVRNASRKIEKGAQVEVRLERQAIVPLVWQSCQQPPTQLHNQSERHETSNTTKLDLSARNQIVRDGKQHARCRRDCGGDRDRDHSSARALWKFGSSICNEWCCARQRRRHAASRRTRERDAQAHKRLSSGGGGSGLPTLKEARRRMSGPRVEKR